MRSKLSTLAEVAGAGLVVAFFGIVWWPLALLVGGAALVLVGYAVGDA